jgi:hypothetical protein
MLGFDCGYLEGFWIGVFFFVFVFVFFLRLWDGWMGCDSWLYLCMGMGAPAAWNGIAM